MTSDGGASITERGVVYSITSINSDPLINGTGVTKLKATGSTGSFTIPVTGLIQGTNYSGKAYATNIQGTSYSSISNFTALSTNAELSALTLSRGTLTPAFASPTIAYTATVSNATTSINVTPTRAQANATIEVRVNGGTYAMVTSGSASPALALNVGLNIVDVRVTAQAGNTKTYTLNVRVNHSPTLSGPSTVAMIEDGQETLAWSVADVDTDINALTLAAAATTNPTLLPLGRVTFSGSGAARMVTIDPVKGQSGTATITITVSDSLDSTSATLAVTVHEKDIVISRQPQSQEVSEQSEARFSVQLHSGGELATYQWFRNNQLLPGSTSSELVLSSVLLSQSGNYHVVITSPYDAETSISAPLVVRVHPEIKQQPNSVMVNVGDRANFAVSALGRPVLNYQWLRNGSNVSGAQAASFAINSTTMAQAGRYQVRITNPANPKGTLSAEAELGVVEAKGSMRLLEMPHSKVLKLSVAAAGNGLSYRWHRNGSEVTANGRTKGWDSKDLTVENISDADNGEYQCRVTGPGGVAWGAVTKVVVFMPPVITQQPESVMANVWDASGFAVFASGDPVLTYQWRHNGKVLTGSRSNILNIPVTMAHAGRYQLMINNPPNQIGILSAEVELGVVEAGWPSRSLKLQKGKMLKLTVAAAGNGLTYRWHRNGDANALTSRATGWATRELIVENLTNADEGDYQCEVSGPGGTTWGAVTTLAVFEQKPKIQRPLLLNDAMVGKNYEFMVPLDLDNGGEATSYSASGLPPGLKIDASSGLISGKPTVAKAEGYFVKVTASNSLGKDEETTGLVVAPLRPGTTGTYAAILRPDRWQNSPAYEAEHYGRLDLVVASTAAYSGSLTLGATKLPVAGVLDIDPEADPTGQLTLQRKGKPDLELSFTLIPEEGRPRQLVGAVEVQLEHHKRASFELLGWRNPWSKSNPASAYAGTYNLALGPVGWSLDGVTSEPMQETDVSGHPVPSAGGYATLTATSNGVLKFAGRMADGESFSGASFVASPPYAKAVFYAGLSAGRGCMAGALDFVAESAAGARDARVSGHLLSWNRAPGAPRSRVYQLGFSSVFLDAVGGHYVPPSKGELLLDSVSLPLVEGNVHLQFYGAGLPEATPELPMSLREGNKWLLPPSGTQNPSKVKFSVQTKTGLFKGDFELVDSNPHTVKGVPQTLKRKATYQGLILPEWRTESKGDMPVPLKRRASGFGVFVLPQMPANTQEILSNTPILGGGVTIQKAAPQ